MVDAEVLGHRHRFDGAGFHAGAQVAVDGALLDATVGERALDRLHVMPDRVEVRRARRVRESDADDHGIARAHRSGSPRDAVADRQALQADDEAGLDPRGLAGQLDVFEARRQLGEERALRAARQVRAEAEVLAVPEAHVRFGSRSTRKRNGSANTSSSRFADA